MSTQPNRKILSLAPKKDLARTSPQFKVYKDFLDEAFDDCDIRNIALSGNLGSGKSSIISSYDVQRNKRSKFLYISLADFTFHPNTDDGSTDHTTKETINELTKESAGGSSKETTKETVKESTGQNPPSESDEAVTNQQRLEYSLLGQILSRCRRCDIPASSLRTIPSKFRYACFLSGMLSLGAVLAFVLIFHNQFGKLAEFFHVKADCRAFLHMGLYGLLGMIIFGTLFWLFQYFLSRNGLQKIIVRTNVADAELDFGGNETSLDVYKYELVYALTQIAKKIDYTVVFEDLDRVQENTAVDIMEKLRELNILTNNYSYTNTTFFQKWFYRIFNRKKHLRFIYAVGEDMFGYEQRTKFFEYILPVVPRLNRCNSEYMLYQLFADCGFNPYQDKFRSFMDMIAPILPDYRSLIAVKNEYLFFAELFKARFKDQQSKDMDNGIELSTQETKTLLAIVIYKTLFPHKYTEAFTPRGQAMLEPITEEDCSAADRDTPYGQLLVETFAEFFRSGILTPLSLVMVGLTHANIVSRWLSILDNGSSNRKLKLLNWLTESNYVNDPEHFEDASRLINAIIDRQYLGRATNQEVAFAIADFLASDDKNTYNWFMDGFRWDTKTAPDALQKQHFLNCIAYSSYRNHEPYLSLCQHGEKLPFQWCLWNLSGFNNNELLRYSQNKKITDGIIHYLQYDPQSIPMSILNKQLTKEYTLGQLLQREVASGANI